MYNVGIRFRIIDNNLMDRDPPCHFVLYAKGIDQISVRKFFQGYSIAEN
jgi:hypothetical protein